MAKYLILLGLLGGCVSSGTYIKAKIELPPGHTCVGNGTKSVYYKDTGDYKVTIKLKCIKEK